MARFELTFLGACSARLEGKPLTGFASDKVRLLLAYLAVEDSRAHPRSQLVEIFWPEHPPQAAHANLRSALSNLRSILRANPTPSAVLETDRETVQLSLSQDCFLDVAAFEAQVAEAESLLAHSDDLPSAMLHYQAAIELYSGGFLDGFTLKDCPQFDDWCYFVRERLLHKASTALSRLASFHESRCDYEVATAFARRRIELEPWQEAAHAHLIRLLALNGKTSEALEQFQLCRQRLQEELDLSPSAETLQLYESIRSGKFNQPQPAADRAANLPAYLTPLVGREKELGEIANLLHDPACRLLSLIGPGGCGKTRLAVETAVRQGDNPKDGVCFVPLVAQDKVEAIVPTILHALEVTTPSADIQHALFSFIRKKELLLVLDNFEQLLPGGAEVLIQILQAAPQVKLLVTSRERLHLDSEVVYLVEGMRLPDPQQAAEVRTFDAVQLFLQTAQRQRGAPISDAELPEVVRTCRSVSGMPLAIKIAASWTRALTCSEIAAEIERSLGFLETDDRELQARHRSVQAVFESTWQLLSGEEQAAFRKLSVFRGGFTRDAFEAVTGASLRILTSLVDLCLVTHRPNGRFELHELLRQFSEEKLGKDLVEERNVLEVHSQFFLEFMRKLDFQKPGNFNTLYSTRFEITNIYYGWLYCLEAHQYELAEKTLHKLGQFAQFHGWPTSYDIFQQSLQALSQDAPELLRARILTLLGEGFLLMDQKKSQEILEQSLEIFHKLEMKAEEAHVLNCLAEAYVFENSSKGIQFAKESIAISQQEGFQEELASSCYRLGLWAELNEQEAYIRKSIEIYRELKRYDKLESSLGALGQFYYYNNNLTAAEQSYRESIQIGRDTDWKGWIVYQLGSLAQVVYESGRLDEAKALFEESIKTCAFSKILLCFCYVLQAQKNFQEMKQCAEQALQGYQEEQIYYLDLGATFQLPFTFVKIGEALCCLGKAEMGLSEYSHAREHVCQALKTWTEGEDTNESLTGLFTWCRLLVETAGKDLKFRSSLALELISLLLFYPGLDFEPLRVGLIENFQPVKRHEVETFAAQLEAQLSPAEVVAAHEYGSKLILEEVVGDLSTSMGRYWVDIKEAQPMKGGAD